MTDNSALLAGIFQAVTKTLVDNKQALNQADDNNHDHGTNMVNTFQTITQSIEKEKNSPASVALEYAAKQLSKETTSGSGKLYAQNLSNAATQFKDQTIDAQSAMQLLQTLIGGGQAQTQQPAQQAGDNLIGSILEGLAGTGQAQQQQAAQPAGNDLLGSLLGSLAGGGTTQAASANGTANNGLDMGDLLNAGMAFMQAKQSGGSNASALIQALVAGSGMGNSNHRTQSTQLVTSAFLQALGGLTKKS